MIKRKQQYLQKKTGNERWLVSYADIVTLLFAVFVVLYSVSYVNESKYKELSGTLFEAFEGRLKEERVSETTSFDANTFDVNSYTRMLKKELVKLDETIAFEAKNIGDTLKISVNANALFASGSAAPSHDAKIVFSGIADQLKSLSGHISVAGHTDNQAINTDQFNDNWALSSARAIAIVQLLQQGGIASKNMSAVAFGEFKPIASNDTKEGRAQNRRVVLTLSPEAGDVQIISPTQTDTALISASEDIDIAAPDLPDKSSNNSSVVDPVEMNNGGLLFTDDPSRAERFDK